MLMKLCPERWRNLVRFAGVISLWLATSARAQSAPPAWRSDQILIKPRPGISRALLTNFQQSRKSKPLQTFERLGQLQVISVPPGETVPDLIHQYQNSGLVEFAEPDYIGHIYNTTPNDPAFTNGTLWGLNIISAPAAWDVLTSASNILVAVLDTGVRYTHEDLAANMWSNPLDGSHGWNVLTGTNDPNDDQGHGTSVAGILGAVGNNGKGVAGVAWQVQIMACKCFNNFGLGTVSSVITGMEFARTNGARIINASWGFPDSLALSNAVYSLRDSNIILVAACGNSATNIDLSPTYPASYHFDNVVTVTDTTRTDTLAAAANYGAASVHLGAPGEQIYTTWSPTDSYYFTQSGTSFAAPYVTGALALLLEKFPAETYQQIIARLLNATDPVPALAGKCVTGGRLNLQSALNPPIHLAAGLVTDGGPFQVHLSSGPNRICVIEVSTDLNNWSPVFTNSTGSSGHFDFTDDLSINSTQRFYRATATP